MFLMLCQVMTCCPSSIISKTSVLENTDLLYYITEIQKRNNHKTRKLNLTELMRATHGQWQEYYFKNNNVNVQL